MNCCGRKTKNRNNLIPGGIDIHRGYFFARIPSVVTSTVGGDALGEKNYIFAFILFAVTAAVSLGGAILFDRISTRRKRE